MGMGKAIRYGKIFGFEVPDGQRIVLHTEKLETGFIDEMGWRALSSLAMEDSTAHSLENPDDAKREILEWEKSSSENNFLPSSQSHDKLLRSLSINVSQLCNLRCSYCFAGDGTFGSTKGLIDVKKAKWQVENAIKRLAQGERFEIRFFGGEPLLHPEAIYQLVEVAEKASSEQGVTVQFEIVTNGTLVTSEIAQYMAEKKFGVLVSIDGPAAIQNKMRPTAKGTGSSQLTEKGLKNLLTMKSQLRFLRSKTVLGEHNLDAQDSFEYLEALGMDSISFAYAVGEKDSETSPRFIAALRKMMESIHENGGEARLRKFEWINLLFDQLDEKYKLANHCLAGKNHAGLDSKNDWFACHNFSSNKTFQIGDFEGDIREAYQTAYSKDHTSKPKCASCPVKNFCGGGCFYVHYTKNGDISSPDKDYCYRQHEFFKLGIEYYLKSRMENHEENERETH